MSELDIDSILDDLVHQFADPLAFFRELVQNSIDAGSGEVEVHIDHEDPDDEQPRAVIEVRDWGEGMDREIIEDEFLRLFSSRKHGDLTKVGRFGIGFVSVFAIDPNAVVVDTGRSGEYWRVVFSEDRSWELYRLERPVEGTTVRIYVPMDRRECDQLRDDARKALTQWCKHPEIPVIYEGKDIRSDFDVDSELTTAHSEEGTRVVMGMVEDEEAPVGYYNRGLTLEETRTKRWPWVSYKIDSRYLEHTLTRDELLEDRHYAKAMELLGELAEDRLPESLIDRLEELAAADKWSPEYGTCCRYLAHYLGCDNGFRRSWRRRSIFRIVDGEPMPYRRARRLLKKGRLHLTKLRGLPGDVLGQDHHIALAARGVVRLMRRLFERVPTLVEHRFIIPRALQALEDPDSQWLKQDVRRILDEGGWTPDGLLFVDSEMLPPELHDKMAVVVPSNNEGAVPPRDWVTPGLEMNLDELPGRRLLVVNTDAEVVEPLLPLAQDEPEWAAYALLDSLFVDDETTLAAVAAEQRARRLEETGR